jgi:uncharacterized SAM-binding protein YcdF (DUF218 family)
MTLAVLVVIVALASFFLILKWRSLSLIVYGVAIVVFFAVGAGVVPQWLLAKLQSPYVTKPVVDWGNRNVIVLLGGGIEKIAHANIVEPGMFSYARIVEAGELYHDCRKASEHCKVIVSGGDVRHSGTTEAAVYRDTLVRIGVATDDFMLDPKSMNTYQNAQYTHEILKTYAADRVLLVSSGIHMQRSVLYFAHFGVAVTPVRADYLVARSVLMPLAYNFAVTDFALHEYIGIYRYRVYNLFGWNAERKLPGQA